MIKYIKELPSNIDNIATLMVTNMDEDKLQLKEKIKVAVRKLTSQTLIQKNGDYFVFLTDDEQDINREIKQMNIDEDIVKRELANYIFQDMFDDKRFNYSKEYAFSYNQKMDEKNYGNQTSSIGLSIVSPLSDHYQKSDQEMMMMTSGSGEMLIKLGGNGIYIEEMEEALRIEEFRKKKNITQLPENIQNILNNKQAEVRERKRRVRELLEDAIKDGAFFVNGDKMDIKGSSVKEKINSAFKQLVDNVYTKLGYVKEHLENERALIPILASDTDQISFDDKIGIHPNELAKREIFDFIDLQNQIQKQIRVKLIYDRFQDKPYGWKQLDIAGLIAELLKEQRIRIRYNAEYLEPETDTNKLLTVFAKTSEADKGIILKRVKVDESLISTAKQVCKEVFNTTNLADDEDGLIKDIRILIEKQIAEINGYKARYEGRKYPGRSLLDKGLEYFTLFDNKLDNASFLTKLKELEDELADWEQDITYVKDFFGTNQKNIFDQGLAGMNKYEESKAYLSMQEVVGAMDKLRSIIIDPVPYRKIKDIPEIVHTLEEQINLVLSEKKENAHEKLKADYDELSLQAKQYGVSNETKQRVDDYYNELKANLDAFTDIFKVDASISQSTSYKERTEIEIRREIIEWQRKKAEEQKKQTGGEVVDPPIIEPVILKQNVKVTELVAIKTLSTEEDVDQYINTLSNKLKQIIKSNKQIEFIE